MAAAAVVVALVVSVAMVAVALRLQGRQTLTSYMQFQLIEAKHIKEELKVRTTMLEMRQSWPRFIPLALRRVAKTAAHLSRFVVL